jgi:hypothetical protein
MKTRHQKILQLIFSRPTPAGLKWLDALGYEEAEGSRVTVFLFGQVRVMHRPHPSPDRDRGAVASLRRWLEENGVRP